MRLMTCEFGLVGYNHSGDSAAADVCPKHFVIMILIIKKWHLLSVYYAKKKEQTREL